LADVRAGCLQLHRLPPPNMQTQIGCTMAQASNNEMVAGMLAQSSSSSGGGSSSSGGGGG
jgi:uncharacterized membrane protein YgcG